MSESNKRRLYQFFGFTVGAFFGYFRPIHIQRMFPLLGITVGISYFILLKITSDPDKELSDIKWFIPVQMVLYFIIGGAISSSILLALEVYSN